MRIRRSKPVDNFTIIPNGTLRDDRLSYCARGILVELLSRPSGWETNADALSERARRHRGDTVGEGRRALRAAFKELEAAGYMLRRREKSEKGRIVTLLEVFDVPQDGMPRGSDRGTGDRGTAGGTSASGMSVDGTSASGTSIRSTDVRRTEEEDSFEEDAPASSSVAAPPQDDSGEAPDGGGGGGESPSKEIAEHITAHLDYRGKPPDKRQRQTILDRLTAAIDSGWSVDGLAYYLDLGSAQVDSPAAVYAHRLRPDILPDAEPLPAAAGLSGIRGALPTAADYEAMTVDSVFGPRRRDTADGGLWERAMARAQARGGSAGARSGTAVREPYRPYSNDVWSQPADPAEAARVPHCGDWDCDPRSRMRDGIDSAGLPCVSQCEKCHPAWQF
jgi:hypothetical protein